MLKKIDKKEIRKLLSDSKLNLAIFFLLDHFNKCDSYHKNDDLHNEILVISMQFNDLESKVRVNVIDYQMFLKKKTELTMAVLNILKEIPCINCEFHNRENLQPLDKSKTIENLNLSENQKKIILEFIKVNFE